MTARWVERMTSVARRDAPGLGLEAIHVASGEATPRGAVVAPPHPLYGGSMESPVVNEVAHACFRAGMDTLRFNWRGVGASSGAPSGEPGDADLDYVSALEHLAESVPGALAGCGYSFGAAAAVRVAGRHPRVKRLVLVAPPPALVDPVELLATGKPTLVVTGARDELAPAAPFEALRGEAPQLEVVRIPDADHFFGTGLVPLARALAAWLMTSS